MLAGVDRYLPSLASRQRLGQLAARANANDSLSRLRVLCVHQGYELYGSDRSFVSAVAALRRMFPEAQIETIIPAEGPIKPHLTQHSSKVRVEPLWVLRRRYLGYLLATSPFTLPIAVVRAIRHFRQSDLVYINTLTVLDYILAAAFFSHKAILHVREIPTSAAGSLMRTLVRAAGIPTIFNSCATRDAFAIPASTPSYVLYNGYEAPESYELPDYRGDRPLRVLMLGRLNSWKGQDLLIEACGLLSEDVRKRLDVRIVGGSFESNTALEEKLHQLSADCGCSSSIAFEPFTAEPAEWYRWCDLVVVPSRLPEPFGRVPVEAMSFARGSIVAGFGGLVETVEHGVNGWHFPPNDAAALAAVLAKAASEPERVRSFGQNARVRYEQCFRQEIVDAELIRIFQERMSAGRATP